MSFASAAPRTLIVHDDEPLTRADYDMLPSRELELLRVKFGIIQEHPRSDEEYFKAIEALTHINAVLDARRTWR